MRLCFKMSGTQDSRIFQLDEQQRLPGKFSPLADTVFRKSIPLKPDTNLMALN